MQTATFTFWLLALIMEFRARTEMLPKFEFEFGVREFEVLLDSVRQVESAGGKFLISRAGAKGPYQLMDRTGLEYHKKLKMFSRYDPFSEEQSRQIAGEILRDYLKMMEGDVNRAVLAYNTGPGNVWKGRIGPQGRAYVPKVEREWRERMGLIEGSV